MEYQAVPDFIRIFEAEEQLKLCIHDYTGFLMADPRLLDAVRPWLAHGCQYCMAVKRDARLFRRCQDMKAMLVRRMEKEPDSFFGMCHAGVLEWVTPIRCLGVLVGALLLGAFSSPSGERRVLRTAAFSGTAQAVALEDYRLLPEAGHVDWERINRKMGLLKANFASVYEQLVRTHPRETDGTRPRLADERLLHALGYIGNHYMTDISVKTLAEVCHCSESTMNHLFKRMMKVNVRFYINKVRIEQAKQQMRSQPDIPVTELALGCGFSDPNYFSSVFVKITGLTPSEYRKRFCTGALAGKMVRHPTS